MDGKRLRYRGHGRSHSARDMNTSEYTADVLDVRSRL